jgi:hypothetical protein
MFLFMQFYAFLQLWLRAFLNYGLCIRVFQSYDKEHFKDMITENSKVYDSIHEYRFGRKENLKLNSAHDYSYENGSYSFEIKYTVKAEPTVLQKNVHVQ